jgi:hypothetical protein
MPAASNHAGLHLRRRQQYTLKRIRLLQTASLMPILPTSPSECYVFLAITMRFPVDTLPSAAPKKTAESVKTPPFLARALVP